MGDAATVEGVSDLAEDYQVQVSVDATVDAVFEALTTLEGLAGWWTAVTGDGRTGGELRFTFAPGAHAVMRVDSAEREVGVRWSVLACHLQDWVGTTVLFDLSATGAGSVELSFRHAGLTPRLECFSDCKNGWDHFIPSLRTYIETGIGQPFLSAADVARRHARAQLQDSADVV